MGTTRNEVTVSVRAPREVLWAALKNVESMPDLTSSMTSVEKLEEGPLRVGMRVRIRQPKLPPAVWTVTEVVENERFVWTAKGLGFRSTAFHEVIADGESSKLRLAVEQSGPLAGLVGRLWNDLTDRYIALEAAGIKSRAEGAA
jgi:carbon monoxide dehydrogenase subunit G